MRVNFASQRIEFTTGYRIEVAKWDADKQRVKNGCTNKLKQSASEINAALLGYYTELQEVFKRFEVAEVMPSPADVRSAFRPKLKDTQKKIIFLTWEELTKLRGFEIPPAKQSLDRVRDVFLFQCFTGLRYSDVYNLRRSDIKEDHIEVTTIKTSDSLVIELNEYSKAILEKYQDVVFEHDNKTIGLLLCNGGYKVVAQYALSGYDQPTGDSDYQPTKAIPDNLKSTQPQWTKLKEIKKELSEITINTK